MKKNQVSMERIARWADGKRLVPRVLQGVVVASCLLVSIPSWAQLTTGTITGSALDTSGARVPGVSVTLINERTGRTRAAATGPSGGFRFEFVELGVHTLKLELDGFRPEQRTGIRLDQAGQVLLLDVVLHVGQLIQDAVIENVAGNGVGMWNHDTADHVNHSSDVELRNVTLRDVGGAFALFASARPAAERAVNSYQRVRLVDVTADAPVAFWGPLRGLTIDGGWYGAIWVGFNAAGGSAVAGQAVEDATLVNLDAATIRINGGSKAVRLMGVRAVKIEHVGSR